MDGVVMLRESDGDWYLSRDEDGWNNHVESRVPNPEELTATALAGLLDQEAENSNHHAFVGCYTWLAETISNRADADVALSVMGDIFKAGGLECV